MVDQLNQVWVIFGPKCSLEIIGLNLGQNRQRINGWETDQSLQGLAR